MIGWVKIDDTMIDYPVMMTPQDNEYYLHRDFEKKFGGMWELTAGGSALQGETPLECAVRELKEETGIEALQIMEIGRFVQDVNHSLYVEYLCVTDSPRGHRQVLLLLYLISSSVKITVSSPTCLTSVSLCII